MSRPLEWHLLDDVIRAPRIRCPRGAWHRWLSGLQTSVCLAKHSRGNRCARAKGRTGRHASYGTCFVVAVWL